MNLISTYVCKVITCPGTIDHKYKNILVFYSLSTFKIVLKIVVECVSLKKLSKSDSHKQYKGCTQVLWSPNTVCP